MNGTISLLLYVVAAFFPGESEPKYAVFLDKDKCERIVAETRSMGAFVTDCTPVKVPAPRTTKGLTPA